MKVRTALQIPGLSASASEIVAHVLIVFFTAFGGVMVSSLTGTISMPAIEAALIAAAAAGVTAVVHFLLGLVPTPVVTAVGITSNAVSLKVTSSLYQVIVSLLVTFVTVFGAQLAAGAVGVASLPGLKALIISAITAAVAAAVQYLVKLVPTPKAAAA